MNAMPSASRHLSGTMLATKLLFFKFLKFYVGVLF